MLCLFWLSDIFKTKARPILYSLLQPRQAWFFSGDDDFGNSAIFAGAPIGGLYWVSVAGKGSIWDSVDRQGYLRQFLSCML